MTTPRITLSRITHLNAAYALWREFTPTISKLSGFGYICSEVHEVHKAHAALTGILVSQAKAWASAYRKEHGKTAVIDDYLSAHAAEICAALQRLEAATEALWRPRYAGVAELASMFDRAHAALDALWALVADEDEEHEIRRTLPASSRSEATISPPADDAQAGERDSLLAWLRRERDADCPWGIIPPKIGRREPPSQQPRPEGSRPAPLVASELIEALDAALAGCGLSFDGGDE